jgi:hypothetical protein
VNSSVPGQAVLNSASMGRHSSRGNNNQGQDHDGCPFRGGFRPQNKNRVSSFNPHSNSYRDVVVNGTGAARRYRNRNNSVGYNPSRPRFGSSSSRPKQQAFFFFFFREKKKKKTKN